MIVDTDYPNAWLEERHRQEMVAWMQQGFKVIVHTIVARAGALIGKDHLAHILTVLSAPS